VLTTRAGNGSVGRGMTGQTGHNLYGSRVVDPWPITVSENVVFCDDLSFGFVREKTLWVDSMLVTSPQNTEKSIFTETAHVQLKYNKNNSFNVVIS